MLSVRDFLITQWWRKDYANKLNKEWKKKNRARNRKTALMRKFGITVEQWDAMLIAQSGLCPICTNPMTGYGEPCVDHCHNTGKVRGLLCRWCNVGLGNLKDSTDLLTRAILYLT